MKTPHPDAIVKAGSLLAMLRKLGEGVRSKKGWRMSELGGDQWFTRGPRYFFAGQARRVGGGVSMEPFWVRVLNESSYSLHAFSGFVEVPFPGVVYLRVTWAVEYFQADVPFASLGSSEQVVSVELLGGSDIPLASSSSVNYTIEGEPPNDRATVISSDPTAVEVIPLVTLDAKGLITHLSPPGLGDSIGAAVFEVFMPIKKIYLDGELIIE
jgi:hypothetical protein